MIHNLIRRVKPGVRLDIENDHYILYLNEKTLKVMEIATKRGKVYKAWFWRKLIKDVRGIEYDKGMQWLSARDEDLDHFFKARSK
jgi:hypothetical protein